MQRIRSLLHYLFGLSYNCRYFNDIIPIVLRVMAFKMMNEIIPNVFVMSIKINVRCQHIGQCFIFSVDKCYSCRCFVHSVSYIKVIFT